MIITEEKRCILYTDFGLRSGSVPVIVRKSLERLSPELELLWNTTEGQYELYRVKQRGITADEDLLHWQISIKTSNLTSGIIDYIKSKDTNPMGANSKDEMKSNWLKGFANARYKTKERKIKQRQELEYAYSQGDRYVYGGHTQISVPITVGFNKKTGKKIMAVPP